MIVDVSLKKVMTHYQICIFKDLRKAVKENIIITRDHIVELYLKSKYDRTSKFEVKITYYHPTVCIREEIVSREEYKQMAETRKAAFAWYKTNLGSAIVKGKIKVLPVIES